MIYKVHYAGHIVFVEAKTKQQAKKWAEKYFCTHDDIDWGIKEEVGTPANVHQTKTIKWTKQCKNVVKRMSYETEQKGNIAFRTKLLGEVEEECGNFIPEEFDLCDNCLKLIFHLNERWGGGCSCCGFDYVSPDDAIRAIRGAINYGKAPKIEMEVMWTFDYIDGYHRLFNENKIVNNIYIIDGYTARRFCKLLNDKEGV